MFYVNAKLLTKNFVAGIACESTTLLVSRKKSRALMVHVLSEWLDYVPGPCILCVLGMMLIVAHKYVVPRMKKGRIFSFDDRGRYFFENHNLLGIYFRYNKLLCLLPNILFVTMATSNKSYDIVLFGVTGFTGKRKKIRQREPRP